MKEKMPALALLAAMLPALVLAYPGFGGGRGLFRVQNALVEQDAGLTVSLHALVRNAEFGPDTSGWIGDLVAPELSYAPIATRYLGLELFGSWGAQFQYPMSSIEEEFVWGLHDLKAGGKLSIPVLPVLKLGGTASYTFIGRESNSPSKYPEWDVLDPEALPYDESKKLSWSGLITLQLQDLLLAAPNVMVNYGKVAGLTQYGGGVELHSEVFSVFVEALSQQPDRVSEGIFDTEHGHVHVTPGLALGNATSGFLKAGYTFSFSKDGTQPNEIILGLGFATPFGRHTQPKYGRIVGTVTDANTGAPLAATIVFPYHPRLAKLTTAASTGIFKAMRVPAGAVTVEVTADGYDKQEVQLMVEGGKPITAAFKLERVVTPVDVTGKVSDKKTGAGLAATVKVQEAGPAVFDTDPTTGTYETRLLPGAYSVVVESKDYLKQIAPLVVEKDKPAVLDFGLVKQGMTITLRGIFFDFDKATIKPESKPALDDAAKILKDNPTIKVILEGHTDSKGTEKYNLDLSNRRARSVVNYLVQNYGIADIRLAADGFGASRPVADNATDEGRALNRRVEFFIVGQVEEK